MEHRHDTIDEEESAQGLLELFEQADWADLTPRLLTYAAYRLGRHGQARRRYSKAADDFVHEALILALSGQRHFPQNADLFGFLCGVIDSLIWHEAERTRSATLSSTDASTGSENEQPRDLLSYDIEREIVAKDEAEHFIASLDADLQAYVRLRVYGDYSTAEEYAKALNTTVAQIRNFDRRLQRMRRSA